MALDGTYSGLKASIADYLNRDDLTAVIPDFITMAESRIARTLRVADMETTATGAMVAGVIVLPSDFIELRRVLNVGSAYNSVLTPITPGSAGIDYQFIASGVPEHYTITGNRLTTYPNGGTGSLTIMYYARPAPLTNTSPGNWLLTKAPEIYLYGSLMEAAPYIMDDARAATWGTLFNQACQQLQNQDDRSRWGRMVSRVDSRYLP